MVGTQASAHLLRDVRLDGARILDVTLRSTQGPVPGERCEVVLCMFEVHIGRGAGIQHRAYCSRSVPPALVQARPTCICSIVYGGLRATPWPWCTLQPGNEG